MQRSTNPELGSSQSATSQPGKTEGTPEQVGAGLEKRLVELTDWAANRMRKEIEQLQAAAVGTMLEESGQLLSGVRERLRQSMQGELPVLEKDLIERCRQVAEPMLALQVEQWTLLLNDRLEKAQQSVAQLVERATHDAAGRCATELEDRFDGMLQTSASRVEQQLDRVGTQARQSFLRHIVAELNRAQQRCLEQTRNQLQQESEQILARGRLNFSELLKRTGEALIRQAYMEGASIGDLLPAGSESTESHGSSESQGPQSETTHS